MKKFEISFIFTSFLIGSKSNMKSLASIIKSSELAVGVNRATTTGNETETVGTVVNERASFINKETETVINETSQSLSSKLAGLKVSKATFHVNQPGRGDVEIYAGLQKG